MSLPTITTQATTDVSLSTATGNGTIVSTGSLTVTKRGFEYNTVRYEGGKKFSEIGSFSTGAFSLTLVGLVPGKRYYVRAWAQNSDGIGYGGWAEFTAVAPTYNITIDSVDRTADILNRTLKIEDVVNDKVNTCRFKLQNLSGTGIPSTDDEISITLDNGTKLFAGYVVKIDLDSILNDGAVVATISCADYTRLLDSNLVHKTYEDMTDKEVIESIIDTYCFGLGITTNNVLEGITISKIKFNYLQPSECFRKIAESTGRNWFIDYDKDIHYFPLTTSVAPFNIDSDSNEFFDLNISKDASQLKNRVYVRGGTKLSDYTDYIEAGDGEKTQFVLPDKPHNVTMYVDRGAGYVEESVGIKNIDTSGYKWYLNFQEKYIEQDSGEDVLESTDKLKLNYKYNIPILVAIEDKDSILEHGQKEFAIFDKSIETTNAARDRASAELVDYAENIIEGSFQTYEAGFISGQYININLSDYGINDDYIVQKVVADAFGSGHYSYTIYVASAKTIGIIKFLIQLLETNKNLIELDEDEVIDELMSISDNLLSDSLYDALTIDSSGPYFTWCTDSLDDEPITRIRWDLFQWG